MIVSGFSRFLIQDRSIARILPSRSPTFKATWMIRQRPAASRIKGNPKEVPLNRIALRALAEDLPSLTDGRVFRRWTNPRAFKAYWEATVRRVGLHDLRFHDLRHTFTTRLQRLGVDYETRQALLGHRMPGGSRRTIPMEAPSGTEGSVRR